MRLKDIKSIDIEKVSAAIEADAGQSLPGLRESLSQAKARDYAAIHTPEKIQARRPGRPVGSKQAVVKESIKIRLDADVVAALRDTGDGWQTRINDTLRASLALAGKVGH